MEVEIAYQSQIDQRFGVTEPSAILPHGRIPSPVIAAFNACPVLADQLYPSFVAAFKAVLAGKIIASFLALLSRLLMGLPAANRDNRLTVGKSSRKGQGARITHLTFLDAPMAD